MSCIDRFCISEHCDHSAPLTPFVIENAINRHNYRSQPFMYRAVMFDIRQRLNEYHVNYYNDNHLPFICDSQGMLLQFVSLSYTLYISSEYSGLLIHHQQSNSLQYINRCYSEAQFLCDDYIRRRTAEIEEKRNNYIQYILSHPDEASDFDLNIFTRPIPLNNNLNLQYLVSYPPNHSNHSYHQTNHSTTISTQNLSSNHNQLTLNHNHNQGNNGSSPMTQSRSFMNGGIIQSQTGGPRHGGANDDEEGKHNTNDLSVIEQTGDTTNSNTLSGTDDTEPPHSIIGSLSAPPHAITRYEETMYQSAPPTSN